MPIAPRRRRTPLFVLLTAFLTILALLGSTGPVQADPADQEGATKALSDKLEAAAKSYYTIKAKLAASQARQAQLKAKLSDAELSLVRLNAVVGQIAAARYEAGQLSVLNGLFGSDASTNDLLQGVAVSNYLVWRDDQQLAQFQQAKDEAQRDQSLLVAEVRNEQKQVADLDQAKRAAEKALASVGGIVSAGFSTGASLAQPAPRNADGSFPSESCSVKDPTASGGCITPRMYHALTEARLAGFSRYLHCWRTQSWGEHPKGRACDFAAQPNGFGGVAAGGDKDYGTRLAAWCLKNAEALGVMYVIWFRQIWMPGIGWSSYFGRGDPSAEHTNHVHLSVL